MAHATGLYLLGLFAVNIVVLLVLRSLLPGTKDTIPVFVTKQGSRCTSETAEAAHCVDALLRGRIQEMCGYNTLNISTIQEQILEDERTIAVGLEIWYPGLLREMIDFRHGLTANEILSLPPIPLHPYVAPEPCPFGMPHVFAAENPNDPGLQKVMMERLEWMGIQKFQTVNFGGLAEIGVRSQWIAKHVGGIFVNNTDHDGHLLATLTAYEFLLQLSTSNDLSEALYLETDAIPVFGFPSKMCSLQQQIRENIPEYDAVFLGTCCDLEHNTDHVKYISPNLLVSKRDRCFNAVLISKLGAQKILGHGPPIDPSGWAIDLMFTTYINDIPLNSFWAMDPLFYEQSKVKPEALFLCDQRE